VNSLNGLKSPNSLESPSGCAHDRWYRVRPRMDSMISSSRSRWSIGAGARNLETIFLIIGVSERQIGSPQQATKS
jgi:hypothetical protein